MRLHLAALIAFLNVSSVCLAMEVVKKETPSRTTKTPCPFINTALKKMEKDGIFDATATEVSAHKLVKFSKTHYGTDQTLMEFLASARSDCKGKISLSELLNPHLVPAHYGSLAREDSDTAEQFAQIDEDRLNVLVSDKRFSIELIIKGINNKYISLAQLNGYKEYCWSLSKKMTWTHQTIGNAEVELLWRLLGAYRIEAPDQTKVIPLKLIDDLLRKSELPDDFTPNTEDPATVWNIAAVPFSSCTLF